MRTKQTLPAHLTKVSYILEKPAKRRLEKAAKLAGCSMSEIISRALAVYFDEQKVA